MAEHRTAGSEIHNLTLPETMDMMIMIMIMTSGWGLQQRPTSPITKIQYTKNNKKLS